VLDTVIDCVVSPFDHKYNGALLDVRVTLPPGQNDVGPEVAIVGAAPGPESETTIAVEVPPHAPLVVTV